MNSQLYWELFVMTGEPFAYVLYRTAAEAGEAGAAG